jgi:hypothetical protein
VKLLDGSRYLFDLGILNVTLSSYYSEPQQLTCSFVCQGVQDFLAAFYLCTQDSLPLATIDRILIDASWRAVLKCILSMIPRNEFDALREKACQLSDQEDLTLYAVLYEGVASSLLLSHQCPISCEVRSLPVPWPHIGSMMKSGAASFLDIQLPHRSVASFLYICCSF